MSEDILHRRNMGSYTYTSQVRLGFTLLLLWGPHNKGKLIEFSVCNFGLSRLSRVPLNVFKKSLGRQDVKSPNQVKFAILHRGNMGPLLTKYFYYGDSNNEGKLTGQVCKFLEFLHISRVILSFYLISVGKVGKATIKNKRDSKQLLNA